VDTRGLTCFANTGLVAVAGVRDTLSGGIRTSIGDADQVIQKLLKAPSGLADVYRGML
jgi:hypothetical protein